MDKKQQQRDEEDRSAQAKLKTVKTEVIKKEQSNQKDQQSGGKNSG